MRLLVQFLFLVSVAAVLVTAQAPQTITIRVGRLIDGRGGSQPNVVVTVRNGKIAAVGQSNGQITHDLSKYTLLPGFIDTHVHCCTSDRTTVRRRRDPVRRAAGIENARARSNTFISRAECRRGSDGSSIDTEKAIAGTADPDAAAGQR